MINGHLFESPGSEIIYVVFKTFLIKLQELNAMELQHESHLILYLCFSRPIGR